MRSPSAWSHQGVSSGIPPACPLLVSTCWRPAAPPAQPGTHCPPASRCFLRGLQAVVSDRGHPLSWSLSSLPTSLHWAFLLLDRLGQPFPLGPLTTVSRRLLPTEGPCGSPGSLPGSCRAAAGEKTTPPALIQGLGFLLLLWVRKYWYLYTSSRQGQRTASRRLPFITLPVPLQFSRRWRQVTV